MSKQNYDTKLSLLESMLSENALPPRTPIDVVVQEAENLYVWIQEDKEALTNIGLDWDTYAEDLPIRAGACRYAQGVWMKERYDREDAVKVWNAKSPDAYTFRNDLLADLRFAFRKRSDLIARVRAIADGSGDADMIQDLVDISVLAKANTAELTTINYDMTRFDQAEQQADELAELLGKANGAILDNSKAKDIRDKAYTHLKEAIDEIRDTGKHLFRKHPERYQGYISRYNR
ncbi:hypothetical protein [Aquimarina aquimarini]|uniref:hypothetical protein n=1 Tax=Aquimarina aquimarini TaxID=1191734 RepID=UPI000D55B8B2|nr:hypothetical protein [Aquimarina aquimarini]